jgi:prepilin-type N-terminal cleavage/methylation domain-containing protein
VKIKKGFTLVELLVVISIIAILLAVLPQKINEGTENHWVRIGLTYYPIAVEGASQLDMYGIPIVTARKFEQMNSQKPFLADRIWNSTDSRLSTYTTIDEFVRLLDT